MTDLAVIRAGIAGDLESLGRELDEIALLAQQAKLETERHEGRRSKGEERVTTLERDPRGDEAELREARAQLLTTSRRAALFEAQQQVLEGKQRTLTRFRDRLAQLAEELDAAAGGTVSPRVASSGVIGTSGNIPAQSEGGSAARPAAVIRDAPDRSAMLKVQEELRREIARHMHDGPAQSLANIALQSEIVQRLASRGDARTPQELDALRQMVQHALDATKEFIFDVRPMVLDDLGLVPTLRRTATDRGRRAGLEIDLDSQGTDRRMPADLESGLYRLIDDAISGYLGLRPTRIVVRLDWGDRELLVAIRAAWLRDADEPRPAEPPPPVVLRDDMPPALRAMIEENRTGEQVARVAMHSLPPERLQELDERARLLGIGFRVSEDGTTMELSAPLPD